MKIVYKAGNITEAHIVSGLLQSNGIEAHVGGFYLQGGVGELAAMDFASVHVPDEDYEQARRIISEYENNQYRSAHPEPRGRASFLPVLLLAVLAFFCIYLLFKLARSNAIF